MSGDEMNVAIDEFMVRFVAATAEAGELPCAEPDDEDPSPCFVDAEGHWKPILREDPPELGIAEVHSSANSWVTRYWRLPIEATHEGREIILSSVMNQRELDDLVQDIELHRRNQPSPVNSMPIGMFLDGGTISVSDDGRVVAEAPGEERGELTADLPAFLGSLAFH